MRTELATHLPTHSESLGNTQKLNLPLTSNASCASVSNDIHANDYVGFCFYESTNIRIDIQASTRASLLSLYCSSWVVVAFILNHRSV